MNLELNMDSEKIETDVYQAKLSVTVTVKSEEKSRLSQKWIIAEFSASVVLKKSN